MCTCMCNIYGYIYMCVCLFIYLCIKWRRRPRSKWLRHNVLYMGVFVCVCVSGYGLPTYMLYMRNEETNTVFYSYLARFVNTFTLNMYVSRALCHIQC